MQPLSTANGNVIIYLSSSGFLLGSVNGEPSTDSNGCKRRFTVDLSISRYIHIVGELIVQLSCCACKL